MQRSVSLRTTDVILSERSESKDPPKRRATLRVG
jgi:hypothetical protein